MERRIGFIGVGNIGMALLEACLRAVPAKNISICEPDAGRREEIRSRFGITGVSVKECTAQSDILFLTIKPDRYRQVLLEMEEAADESKLFVTVAPGIGADWVQRVTGKNLRVVRAMPNTPALLGEGMTGVAYPHKDRMVREEIRTIEAVFSSCGKLREVREEQMDAVICASGSAPAFVYLFMDYMAEACVRDGIDKETALLLVAQTVRGAAKMVQETGEPPELLCDRVCSPGGTTIEGVRVLREGTFRETIERAVEAVYGRAREMSKA